MPIHVTFPDTTTDTVAAMEQGKLLWAVPVAGVITMMSEVSC